MTSKKYKSEKRKKYRKLIEKNEGKEYANIYFNELDIKKVNIMIEQLNKSRIFFIKKLSFIENKLEEIKINEILEYMINLENSINEYIKIYGEN